MKVVWILSVFNCFWLIFGNNDITDEYRKESNERNAFEFESFPSDPNYVNQTRTSRTLFKKLYSSAAFLTGLKLGAVLSKKGFELGHGKIASTHSFQVFGKSVNSAMSLSYGNSGSLIPLVDDVPEAEMNNPSKRTTLKKKEENIFRVTVVENPSNETLEKLQSLPLQTIEEKANEAAEDDVDGRINDNIVMLYQDFVKKEPEEKTNSGFLEEHNKRVKEFNESILRRNNKF